MRRDKEKGLKIVVAGGGSSYTPEIADGLIKRQAVLKVDELVLLDIEDGRDKVELICNMVIRMFKSAGMETKVRVSMDPEDAFLDCSYIICQIRAGGLKARALDERIPLKYGIIGQETTGAGGLFNGLRSIPQVLKLAKCAERICPQAWFINFANPAGMVTEAILRETNLNAVGLCNVPINMATDIAERLETDRDKLYVHYFGLNHLSWVTGVRQDGIDRLPELLMNPESRQLLANVPKAEGAELLLEKIGVIPSPYLNYYYFEKAMLEEEANSSRNEGTRAEVVMNLERELFMKYGDCDQSDKPVLLEKRGGSLYSEAAISLIESLQSSTREIHVLNVRNRGAMKGLPEDCVVETSCIVGNKAITPILDGYLPVHAMSLVEQIKTYELCAIEAALTGDRRILMEAMLCHPLIRGAMPIGDMMEELLEAHRAYLPLFFKTEEN